MSFFVKTFEQLTTRELYDIYQLRCDVFVVERDCVYPEVDGKDPDCIHIFNEIDGEIASYARILPPGLKYEQEVAIGRVVVRSKFRGQRLGEHLIAQGIKVIQKQWPHTNVRLSAQAHLQPFYHLNGFVTISDVYLEENLPHIAMELKI